MGLCGCVARRMCAHRLLPAGLGVSVGASCWCGSAYGGAWIGVGGGRGGQRELRWLHALPPPALAPAAGLFQCVWTDQSHHVWTCLCVGSYRRAATKAGGAPGATSLLSQYPPGKRLLVEPPNVVVTLVALHSSLYRGPEQPVCMFVCVYVCIKCGRVSQWVCVFVWVFCVGVQWVVSDMGRVVCAPSVRRACGAQGG